MLAQPFTRIGLALAQLVSLRRWAFGLLLLSAPAAFAQLNGAYTINNAQPTGGTNYTSFTAASAALNSGGVSGPVTFTVSGGPYTEQLIMTQFAGVSATNRVTFEGGGRTIQFGSANSARRAVVTLDGADYVTLNNLVVDATVGGTSTAIYGYGVQLVNNADNNVISNCTITASTTATSINYVGITSSASATAPTTGGATASQDLTLQGNTITGGYYGIAVAGKTSAPSPGLIMRNNTVRDFYFYGLFATYLSGPQIVGNDISRPARLGVATFYGLFLSTGVSGAAVEKNRIHQPYPSTGSATGGAYGLYITTGATATVAAPNEIINNVIYDFNTGGFTYAIYNGSSANTHYYHNTVSLDSQNGGGTGTIYGFYHFNAAGVEFKNNIVQVTTTGGGAKYALYFGSTIPATSPLICNYNDLVVGAGENTGYYAGTPYLTLAAWRTANAGAYDQNSTAAAPRFVGAAGSLIPSASALNGTAQPLARVTDDISGAPRSATPDMGAYEFTPIANDVGVVSIDSPVSPALPGANSVTANIVNNGGAVLTSVTLSYSLNSGTPVTQAFSGLSLASNATQQLTFSTPLIPLTGPNTLVITATLPNGQVDGNPADNSQSLSFVQPTPPNDEPCTAVPLGSGPLTSSNSGATTSIQPGINLPACSPAQAPKDVWFSFTPAGSSVTITLSGAPAGMVRVYSTPDCANGPFTQVFCQSSGANNTSVGTVTLTGLTAGQRYYITVSGHGSSDVQGQFTISATLLGSRPATQSLFTVHPNPSSTGQLALTLGGIAGKGTIYLFNALGQAVLQQPLSGAAVQQVVIKGLASGLYTLQVQVGAEVLTRKVVLD